MATRMLPKVLLLTPLPLRRAWALALRPAPPAGVAAGCTGQATGRTFGGDYSDYGAPARPLATRARGRAMVSSVEAKRGVPCRKLFRISRLCARGSTIS